MTSWVLVTMLARPSRIHLIHASEAALLTVPGSPTTGRCRLLLHWAVVRAPLRTAPSTDQHSALGQASDDSVPG